MNEFIESCSNEDESLFSDDGEEVYNIKCQNENIIIHLNPDSNPDSPEVKSLKTIINYMLGANDRIYHKTDKSYSTLENLLYFPRVLIIKSIILLSDAINTIDSLNNPSSVALSSDAADAADTSDESNEDSPSDIININDESHLKYVMTKISNQLFKFFKDNYLFLDNGPPFRLFSTSYIPENIWMSIIMTLSSYYFGNEKTSTTLFNEYYRSFSETSNLYLLQKYLYEDKNIKLIYKTCHQDILSVYDLAFRDDIRKMIGSNKYKEVSKIFNESIKNIVASVKGEYKHSDLYSFLSYFEVFLTKRDKSLFRVENKSDDSGYQKDVISKIEEKIKKFKKVYDSDNIILDISNVTSIINLIINNHVKYENISF